MKSKHSESANLESRNFKVYQVETSHCLVSIFIDKIIKYEKILARGGTEYAEKMDKEYIKIY